MYTAQYLHVNPLRAQDMNQSYQAGIMSYDWMNNQNHIDGLLVVQDCSNSIANALELLQSCTTPSIYGWQDTEENIANRACCPGGHYWDYYPGTPTLMSRHYSFNIIHRRPIFKWVAETSLHDGK